MTPVAGKRGNSGDFRNVGVDLATDSTSNERKRRKVDGGEGFSCATSSCWCGNLIWNNRTLCPKVHSHTDTFSLKNLEDDLGPEKYADTKGTSDFLSPKATASSKHLDVTKSTSGQCSSSGKFGTVTENLEELLARKDRLLGCLGPSNFMTPDEDSEVEKKPEKENLKSNPSMFEIIDLEDDDEPPYKGTTVQSAIEEENGKMAHFVPYEEKQYKGITLIDLEEDEDLDKSKNLFTLEVIDSREPASNFSEKSFEDQGCAENQGKREENYWHAIQTEVNQREGAIDSNQTIHKDDQVIVVLDCAEEQRLHGANMGLACEPEHKTDNGITDGCQTFNTHDKLTKLACAEGQRSRDGNICRVEETELQKDEGIIRKSDFQHAGETSLRKDAGSINMEEESAEKIEEAKEPTKASSDGVAYVSEVEKGKGMYVEGEDVEEVEEAIPRVDSSDDDLDSIWNDMSLSLHESCQDTFEDSVSVKHSSTEGAEDCDHSFILKDDIGSVCRVCGLIERGIETMIEYTFAKRKSGRTYKHEHSRAIDSYHTDMLPDGTKRGENDCSSFEVAIHPRHQKVMKPHQLEGFNFLMSNLVADDPRGCILAHAPGSGKTFMIISFLQSFMAKYPSAKPLIVLPRGILSTWRNEFLKWQVEDTPLYDFYSSKADSRSQQLEVLRKWANERSVLFLGYKQFTVIVGDTDADATTKECQKFLVKYTSILIMDEGHTPRNDNTVTLKSLEMVQTPRKVILSGTLFQNHVKEVFNVLNLVRPKFLETEPPRSIKRRILSKVQISSQRNSIENYPDDLFYDEVERAILDYVKFNRKVNIIHDLREMTRKVLHYYKGDSLDELPGLVDFTVFLELTARQKTEVEVLKKCKNRFKIMSEGSLIYVHPRLKTASKIDLILENLEEIGVKAKFYLNLLQLCELMGEKLLVFSQYLAPLKLLERLTVKVKNYAVGKEIFVITGDCDGDVRDYSVEQFNTSPDSRVFFGSIKACGEGISLVGASRIIILDTHLNPSVTRQAIGRAFRPEQKRKVYTYRLVASGSPEEEDHLTCFRKECIAKMWFEWTAYQSEQDFEMEKVDVNDCGDRFLESARLNADVVSVCKKVNGWHN